LAKLVRARPKPKKQQALEDAIVKEIPWAKRVAKHVLRRAPTCGLPLEDLEAVAIAAMGHYMAIFDARRKVPFQLFAFKPVMRKVWTAARNELLYRIRLDVMPAAPTSVVDAIAEICSVSSPLAMACQYLSEEDRRRLGLWMAGKVQIEEVQPILDQLREELLDRGMWCADDLLER